MSNRYEHRPRIHPEIFYRVGEMAQLLDISQSSAYSLVQNGEIFAKKIGKKKWIWRIPGRSILEYFDKKEQNL